MIYEQLFALLGKTYFSVDYFWAYCMFIILPASFLLAMYFFNKYIKDTSPWYEYKLITTLLLIFSIILFILYFVYIVQERSINIKLSLSIVFPMFAMWLISELYEGADSSEIRSKINGVIKNIKNIDGISDKVEESDLSDEDKSTFRDNIRKVSTIKDIQDNIHKIDIQGQIITTLIVLISLISYIFFSDINNKLIIISIPSGYFLFLLIKTIRIYSKSSDNVKDTTLYFSWFSFKNSPTLLKSFLIPRAISVIMVIWFSIYYNPVMQKNNNRDKRPTKKGNEITVIAENNNTK